MVSVAEESLADATERACVRRESSAAEEARPEPPWSAWKPMQLRGERAFDSVPCATLVDDTASESEPPPAQMQ